MKRKWFWVGFVSFFVVSFCWMLFGITINFPPKSPSQRLDEARGLWEVKGSSNYQMDIQFGSMTYIGGFRIVVRDNQVKDIFSNVFNSLGAEPISGADQILDQSNPFAQGISPDLKKYTVEGLFNIAKPYLENQPKQAFVAWCSINSISPNVSFNIEYGYIQTYKLSSCPEWEFGGGLLCPKIGDCHIGLTVSNFEILPQSN